MRMTTEEAFVKVLQRHGIEHVFGIIGSAFMPISDLFPKAGITFWDVAHESNAGFMCDGYTRATGKIAMCIGQNGPGITNLVTPVKTAYWNHTPMLLVTPQAANKTIGQGGFQEVEQMALFEDMVCYQEEVRDASSRMAEVLNRVIEKAVARSAPAQINMPRDLLDPGDRHRAAADRARLERPAGGRGLGGGRGEAASPEAQLPGDPVGRRRGDRRTRSPNAGRWPSASTRRFAAATSTTTASPARTRWPPARSATTAPRRRWS